MWTTWEFRSPSSPQIVRVIRTACVDDRRWEHYYQRIAYRGESYPDAKAASECPGAPIAAAAVNN